KKIPITFWVMTVATFTIAGFPPLAAFFSKDEILSGVYSSPYGGHLLWAIGVITAGLTSFYMFRLWFMTFFGEYKPEAGLGDAHLVSAGQATAAAHGPAAHPGSHSRQDDGHRHRGRHESPWVMLAPLVMLAVLAIVGGWVGIPRILGGHNAIEHFLAPVMEPATNASVEGAVAAPEAHIPSPAEVKTSTEWILTGIS